MSDTDVTLATGCPRCGRALAADAIDGLCAACLLAAGTETLTHGSDDLETVLSRSVPSVAGGPVLEAGMRWGPYLIGRLLGRGGMGEVYEAEHTDTGRRVALKVLRSRLQNPEDRARFLREGQLAASVSHPHTVYIFGSEEIGGSPTISMELLPGGTLKDRVAERGPLPTADAVSAVLDIIGGLDAAQAAGILHRDIKPSNCFVDADGTVKVGDFGLSISTLARDVHNELETTGFQGTPAFAPPEQLRGEPLDVRADIYAVGATLYYLLTGRPPFEAQDLRELVAQVTSAPAPPIRRLRRDLPPRLAAVVMQCLAKAPAQRPASYAALADALRPFSGEALQPAPLGLRFVAGLLDTVLLIIAVGTWTMVSINVMTGARLSRLDPDTVSTIAGITYFFLLETLTGASLCKRLLGLRVVLTSGAPASWIRIGVRSLVFYLPGLLTLLIVSGASAAGIELPHVHAVLWGTPEGKPGGRSTFDAETADIIRVVLGILLYVSMRRHNGFAALQDLFSGTRVIRASAPARSLAPRAPVIAAAMPAGGSARRYGPFKALSDAGDTREGRLVLALDPLLRRHVWIHDVAPGTAAVSEQRRSVSRVGRLHWLTGRRSASENWDTYEAADGEALLNRKDGPIAWTTLKRWLLDLSRELVAAREDGSTPVLALDRLWVRGDGQILLLDFTAPGVREPGGGATGEQQGLAPVALLSGVAEHVRSMHVDDPAWLPLSARQLLDRWSGASAPPLEEALAMLVDAADRPDRVTRTRRATPLALATAPLIFALLVSALVVPSIFGFMSPENIEILTLLDGLSQPNPQPPSRMRDPVVRDAVERYLAGRHGAKLASNEFWSMPAFTSARGNLGRLRTFADQALARHPEMTPEQTAAAEAAIGPELKFARGRTPGNMASMMGMVSVIASFVTGVMLAAVICLSVLSSMVVPGGFVTGLVGLAVVNRRGARIGRLRALVRVIVAWLPGIIWLAYLVSARRVQGFVPAPANPLLGVGLTLGILAAGAMWTIARPSRGLADRVVGAWVVPR
jgi:serine/threonine protein kinase